MGSLLNNIRYFVAASTKSWIAAPNPDDSPQSRHSQHFLFLQSQTGDELTTEEPARMREAEDENIHYGEIDFSMHRPKTSSDLPRDSGQQQEILYAQVKVSRTTTTCTTYISITTVFTINSSTVTTSNAAVSCITTAISGNTLTFTAAVASTQTTTTLTLLALLLISIVELSLLRMVLYPVIYAQTHVTSQRSAPSN